MSSNEAFLQGERFAIDLAKADADLAKLWGDAAAPDVESPATKLVLANLVVAGRRDGMEEILPHHPSRAIVLSPTSADDATVRAEATALCTLPVSGTAQVCSEIITLEYGDREVGLVPSAVRSLLEPDLPVVLWWRDDPDAASELYRALARDCSRVLVDLPDPGPGPSALQRWLTPDVNAHVQDVAWFAITPWRELIAQRFDPPALPALGRITSLTVQAVAPRDGVVPRVAAWLVGWLAGQLGWSPLTRRRSGPNQVDAVLNAAGRKVNATIRTRVVPELDRSHLAEARLSWDCPSGQECFIVVRSNPESGEIQTKNESPSFCSLPRQVASPPVQAVARVVSALQASRDDPPFVRAKPVAFWLMAE